MMNGNLQTHLPHRNWLYEGNQIDLTWAQIQAKLGEGKTNFMKTGDYKNITLTTGEVVVMEFAGWTYTKSAASYNKNCADFISRDCLATRYKMNSTSTQAGGFVASDLYGKLKKNGAIYNTLPSDLKPYIGVKRVFGLQYVAADNNKMNQAHHVWDTFDGLWLPTEIEVYGHRACSCTVCDSSKQYELFKSEKHTVKKLGISGEEVHWWESSPAYNASNYFCHGSPDGRANAGDANNDHGVVIAFRISEASS